MKICKILCALLPFCLLLCGCGKGQRGGQDLPPAVTTVPVADSANTEAERYVKAAREQTFSYTAKNDASVSATYRIPRLTLETTDARRINGDISAKYSPLFTAAQEAAAQNKSPEPETIDYNAYVNDDIITIIVTCEEQSHSVTYDVYNYNKLTGKRMDNVDLLTYLQRDYDDTFNALGKALEADYTAKFKEENFPDDYYYQLDLSAGDEGIRKSKLFLNANAELYAVCTEYASVGSGEYQVLIRC